MHGIYHLRQMCVTTVNILHITLLSLSASTLCTPHKISSCILACFWPIFSYSWMASRCVLAFSRVKSVSNCSFSIPTTIHSQIISSLWSPQVQLPARLQDSDELLCQFVFPPTVPMESSMLKRDTLLDMEKLVITAS